MDNKLANDQFILFYFILFKLYNHWKRRDLNLEFLNLLKHQDLSIELQEYPWWPKPLEMEMRKGH